MVENLYIKNLDTNKQVLMNMSDADYLLYEGGIDWGSVNVTHNTTSYSSLLGEYPTSTVIGSRDISIAGWIIGKTEQEIFNKKEVLSTLINPLQDLRIKSGDYGIDVKASTNVTFSNTYEENNDKMCKFLIQLFCPFPLFTKNNDSLVLMEDEVGGFHFPFEIPESGYIMSVFSDTRFQDIINDGAISIGIKVVFEANGVVNNPTIVNVTTQEQMKIDKVLNAGEIVTISSQSDRYVTGTINGKDENYLDYFDYDNTWMQLSQGLNTLTVKTYDENGEEDETYKNLKAYLYYNPCVYNLKEE